MFINKLSSADLKELVPNIYNIDETKIENEELVISCSLDLERFSSIIQSNKEKLNEYSDQLLEENDDVEIYLKNCEEPIFNVFVASDFSCGTLPNITNSQWQIFMLDKFGDKYYNSLKESKLAEPETTKYYKGKSIKEISENLEQTTLETFIVEKSSPVGEAPEI